jgi:hypothetical protein
LFRKAEAVIGALFNIFHLQSLAASMTPDLGNAAAGLMNH